MPLGKPFVRLTPRQKRAKRRQKKNQKKFFLRLTFKEEAKRKKKLLIREFEGMPKRDSIAGAQQRMMRDTDEKSIMKRLARKSKLK